MTGSFHISLFEATFHVDKIHVWFKIANITHALPVTVYGQTDFTPKREVVLCLHDTIARFVPEGNSHPGIRTGVDYLVNIAQELKQSQTSSVSFDSSKLEEFVSLTVDNFVTQFNIPLIIIQETQKFIDNLSSSKATGADEITVKVLKLVSPVFVQPLTRLINLSIKSGCYPAKWKMARHISL